MFKLKPGNVFQKINKMDKKQAYTWGAIVIVCFIALITLASFMGDADETSFDGLNTRGYDLAQMPFINDEAEEYLLASKYPDMQGNNSTMLYSSAEKEARQEEDAAKAAEEAAEGMAGDSSGEGVSGGYSGGGYSGGGYAGGGAGGAGPTQVGQLGSASMGRASGGGVGGSWGAPRGDFSPYKTQEKGSELPVQFKNNDARRALSQFAQTSRAAAGFKDSKGANAKRALMGGNVQGSEAFTEGGVDLSKSGGLALDTNAPVSTADLSNLDKDLNDAANKAKDEKDEDEEDFRQSLGDKLLEQFLSGVINMAVDAVGGLFNQGMDAIMGSISANSAARGFDKETSGRILSEDFSTMSAADKQTYADALGVAVDSLPDKGATRDHWRGSRKGDYSGVKEPKFSSYSVDPTSKEFLDATPSELDFVALGNKQDPTKSKNIIYNKKEWDADYESSMREADIDSFRQRLETARASNPGSKYALERKEVRATAFKSKRRNYSNKDYSVDRPSSGSSSGGGSGLNPRDYHTQTQWKIAIDNKYTKATQAEKEAMYKEFSN